MMGLDSRPSDELHVWAFLPGESVPQICGVMTLLQGRKATFAYDPNWLVNPRAFALCEDLPLRGSVFAPPAGSDIHPIFDDAGPDRWGRAVINAVFNPPRRSAIDYLALAGDSRIGALAFSESRDVYEPDNRAVYTVADLGDLFGAADALSRQQPVSAGMLRLLQPGSSAGGARPKAVVQHRGAEWIAKFRSPDDEVDFCAIEHASLQLARECGLRVAQSELVSINGVNAVLVKRFDRNNKDRLHFCSARSLLMSSGVMEGEMGYSDIADLIRSGGVDPQASCRELFSRMVFNILIENTDDHEKNHAFLRNGNRWELSPAFDMLPQLQGLGYQQLRVGKHGSASSLSNAVSDAQRFMLRPSEAIEIAHDMAVRVRAWEHVFAEHGVSQVHIDACKRFILRPQVLDLRSNATATHSLLGGGVGPRP